MDLEDEKMKDNNVMAGLYLFTNFPNSVLYSYSMLLQVSLPRLPNADGVRMFIGWWWLYSILVAVLYRASMTAALANPIARYMMTRYYNFVSIVIISIDSFAFFFLFSVRSRFSIIFCFICIFYI